MSYIIEIVLVLHGREWTSEQYNKRYRSLIFKGITKAPRKDNWLAKSHQSNGLWRFKERISRDATWAAFKQ